MNEMEFEKCAICGEEATFIDTTLTGLIFYCEAHGTVKGLTRGIPDEPDAKCQHCQTPIEEGVSCAPCGNERMV